MLLLISRCMYILSCLYSQEDQGIKQLEGDGQPSGGVGRVVVKFLTFYL